jgi:hypothetical protein
MEAKELRIGNYASNGENVMLVDCHTIYDNTVIFNGLKSIPLTEEWLLKFGFKKGTIENDNWAFTIFFYDIWRVIYKEKKGYGSADVYLENFWSVHQLQNLYFALTNKEL